MKRKWICLTESKAQQLVKKVTGVTPSPEDICSFYWFNSSFVHVVKVGLLDVEILTGEKEYIEVTISGRTYSNRIRLLFDPETMELNEDATRELHFQELEDRESLSAL